MRPEAILAVVQGLEQQLRAEGIAAVDADLDPNLPFGWPSAFRDGPRNFATHEEIPHAITCDG